MGSEAVRALVRDVSFSTVRWREGYAPEQVDAFLERLRRGLDGEAPPVTASQVVEVLFTAVRLRPGYDMRQVDELLRAVEGHLRVHEWSQGDSNP